MNKKKKKNIIKDYESEKDMQMIGCEPNSTPTYFHIMETVRNVLNEWGGYNRIPDISEIGEFVYSMDFDEDEYQEYLQDNELEDNDENKKTFIMDYVEFDFELLDSETYHSLGYYKLSYSDIENNFDEFGEPLACQVLNDCLKFGKGNIEKELLSSPSMNVDVNNPDSINMAAVKILPNGAYYKGCRGFILTNGVVVYTEAEHSHCMEIPGIKGTYDFVWKGNIRLIKDSINVWVKPTIEQKRTLLSVIRCYANEHLIISVCQNGEIKYKDFIHPNAEEIFNFLDRIYGVNESFSTIINEEIQRVLKENYFASRYEKECRETAERIMKKLNYEIYEREQSNEKMTFRIDEYINLPYKDSNNIYKIDVFVWYDQNRPLKKFYGHCYENYDIIECYIGKNVTFDFIFGTLQHELTHILDTMIINQKNIKKSYRIQPKNINNKIDEIMYRLWDTSEFNAQQVPTWENYHNVFVQHIMNLLNDVYYDETIDWKQVGVMIQNYEITKRIKPNTPPEVVKKYFFDTSFKKLKKFIKKTI